MSTIKFWPVCCSALIVSNISATGIPLLSHREIVGVYSHPQLCPSRHPHLHPDEIDTEAALMQALAEREEDDRLDDAVEINSDHEFTG